MPKATWIPASSHANWPGAARGGPSRIPCQCIPPPIANETNGVARRSRIGPTSPNGVMEATMAPGAAHCTFPVSRSNPRTGVRSVGEATMMSAAAPKASSTIRASPRETFQCDAALVCVVRGEHGARCISPLRPIRGSRLIGSAPGGSTLITSAPRSARSFVQ